MKAKKEKVAVGMINPPRLATIDEVEARRHFARFKAETIAEYEAMIRAMDDADMRTHASSVGLKPSNERAQLILTLINYFRTAKASASRYNSDLVAPPKTVVSRKDDYNEFISQFRK